MEIQEGAAAVTEEERAYREALGVAILCLVMASPVLLTVIVFCFEGRFW
jgi:hypothetical protein